MSDKMVKFTGGYVTSRNKKPKVVSCKLKPKDGALVRIKTYELDIQLTCSFQHAREKICIFFSCKNQPYISC